jgi:hypothetical protein
MGPVQLVPALFLSVEESITVPSVEELLDRNVLELPIDDMM